MKKFSYIIFSLIGILFATASCDSPMDENPVLKTPTKFVLNTPALADQYVQLSPTGTVNLTFSQPDYGFAAIADYFAQISLTEDFKEFVEVNSEPSHLCDMDVSSANIAEGICKLRGITTEEGYTDEPAREVYFRIRSTIKNADVEQSTILSNVVKMNKIKGYFALKLPGYIYLVGEPEGWAGPTAGNKAHYDEWRLFESTDAVGSKIYSAEFDIPADKASFRFYTALTGWDADSYGSQEEDNPLDFEFDADGVYVGPIVKGKGSLRFPSWTGGKMLITVDMAKASKMTISIKPVK